VIGDLRLVVGDLLSVIADARILPKTSNLEPIKKRFCIDRRGVTGVFNRGATN
jgi:hypothetical protein